MPTPAILDLARRLSAAGPQLAAAKALVGFDGFVDERLIVVGERQDTATWTRMASLADFGAVANGAAGRAALREVVPVATDAGGCAVNLADGLAAVGASVHLAATIGAPRHPAFEAVCKRVAGVTDVGFVYGRTLALEFPDGKLMLSSVAQLAEITPELLAKAIEAPAFQAAARQSRVLALTNWTLYPHMTACWKMLQEKLLPRMAKPRVLCDLVDPGGRTADDIRAMVATLPGFRTAGGSVTLGLNANESKTVSRALGLPEPDLSDGGIAATAQRLAQRIGVDEIALHTARLNAIGTPAGTIVHPAGPHCPNPKKTTGAGDRFNAGFVAGMLLELSPEDRLRLAAAVSGAFVRDGESPSLATVVKHLEAWGQV
jgi:sugar/nucleoside kinase (ribokinase family)